ncbi:mechanosensitive ion channel protein 6-like [Salvia miltiorrhiza]|uniref:mechanosensitive ion channel protein 6-like n=1 Tax=Salvia miltiorrhiza TaxID=226208 RepID=UPI0025AB8978|nr:mechanosensitive ion channel protein 6-like [Salvia miltiorrhiza]
MDLSPSRRKSSKSFMHGRKISLTDEDLLYEEQPILSDHRRDSTEIIVKIDSDDPSTPSTPIFGNPATLDFWKDHESPTQPPRFDLLEDPPSKLINQFLNKQKATGGDFCLDVDLEMEELRNDRTATASSSSSSNNNNNSSNSNSRSLPPHTANHDDRGKSRRYEAATFSSHISAEEQEKYRNEINESPISSPSSSDEDRDDGNRNRQSTLNRRRSMNNPTDVAAVAGDGQVLKCTSSIQRNYGRMKTKSRLLDPPDATPDRRTDLKSGQLRSENIGRASGMVTRPGEDEEEDPLFDEDLPDEYKRTKFSALTFIEWISLILIVTALICTTSIDKWKVRKFRGLHLWKWEVLILVLICGRLVSGWGIRIVVFFIERNFFMRKRVLYFVYGVKRSVQNCIWLGLVLIAWHSMFDQRVQGNNKFLWYVNTLLVCMIVGTLLWLVKTLMVKVLASSFHVSTFFDRIQESLFNQKVIEALSGPPHIEIKKQQEEEERTMAEVWRLQNAGATLPPDLRPSALQKSGKVNGGGLPPRPMKGVSFKLSGQMAKNMESKNLERNKSQHDDKEIVSMENLHKLNHKNVSAWNMKRLMKVVKKGVLTTLDEQVQHSTEGDDASTQIRSECEAKCAARKIFRNVAKPKSKYIYLEDLMRFLPEQDALKTLNAVEGSTEADKISKASLKSWVVNAFIERRALALTLNDTKTAVDKLHHMVNVIVGLIILVVCLVILEIATSKLLLYISSQIVVVAFIFGNTCKTVFEAVIFVFVIHPFDVGDRCEIDGVQMVVEEMNILTTVFLRYDNLKIIYPNVTLATRPIGNFYRSPDMGDSVDFVVHIGTPVEKIALIKQRIIAYIEIKNDYWYPQPSVVVMNIEQLHMVKLSVWVRHKMNHQNMGDKWKRRALLVEETVKILKELDIEYRLYPIDVNVRAMPPITSTRMPPGWSTPSPAS